jgi:hypothetical protein
MRLGDGWRDSNFPPNLCEPHHKISALVGERAETSASCAAKRPTISRSLPSVPDASDRRDRIGVKNF